jgi:hypothetical protein
MTSPYTKELEHHGIVVLNHVVSADQLARMRGAFERRLRRLRWSHFEGYEKTERYRHMVQDVLTLDQAFLDVALHADVRQVLREYVGERYELVEAKGWKSLPTRRDFHGWHGDAWYDQSQRTDIPREVKLGVYLSEVKSGAFNYVKGSHGQQAPHGLKKGESENLPADRIVEVTGRAGLAFLFDTSGIHRQSVPILEERLAVFYNYHDPSVPLQREDVEYYRYHPLLLNAAFLGGLSEEEQRILGFGNKTHYQPDFERKGEHELFQRLMRFGYDLKLTCGEFAQRVTAKLRKILRLGR